jgi:hypothetical protein
LSNTLPDQIANIDFSLLPFSELAESLQLLGKHLVVSLLLDQVPHSLDKNLFPDNIANRLVYIINTDPPKYSQFIKEIISGNISREQFEITIRSQLLLALEIARPGAFPPLFVQLAGIWAWRAPEYQYWMAEIVQTFLLSRYLFLVDEKFQPPVIRFSERTFWSLMLLVPKEVLFPVSTQEKNQSVYQVYEYLCHVAEEQILITGWADFWDQWLLAEACSIWGILEHPVSPKVTEAIQALPYFAIRNHASMYKKSSSSKVSLAKAKWSHNLPKWMKENNKVS